MNKLANTDGIKTITPAVITSVRGRSDKFRLRVSIPIIGGYKLIARKGNLAQEVFIITSMKEELLSKRIDEIINNG